MLNENIDFFLDFSLPTVIIAVTVAVISLLIDRFVKIKNLQIKTYIPMILGVLFNFIYDMIFVTKGFMFREEIVYTGLIAASLSGIIFSLVKRIENGQSINVDKNVLAIEKIIDGLFLDDLTKEQTAVAINNILISNFETENFTEDELASLIADILRKNSGVKTTENEYLSIAKLTVKAVLSIKK